MRGPWWLCFRLACRRKLHFHERSPRRGGFVLPLFSPIDGSRVTAVGLFCTFSSHGSTAHRPRPDHGPARSPSPPQGELQPIPPALRGTRFQSCLFVAAAETSRNRCRLNFADALDDPREAFALARPPVCRARRNRHRPNCRTVRLADPVGDTLAEPLDHVFADFTAFVERVVHRLVCRRCDCHRCSVLSRFRGLFHNLPAAACFSAAEPPSAPARRWPPRSRPRPRWTGCD